MPQGEMGGSKKTQAQVDKLDAMERGEAKPFAQPKIDPLDAMERGEAKPQAPIPQSKATINMKEQMAYKLKNTWKVIQEDKSVPGGAVKWASEPASKPVIILVVPEKDLEETKSKGAKGAMKDLEAPETGIKAPIKAPTKVQDKSPQMPSSKKPSLEEEFHKLMTDNATLNMTEIGQDGSANPKNVNISEPENGLNKGDTILKGEAAREFISRLQNGEDKYKILEDIKKNPRNDVFTVENPKEGKLKDFFASIEQEKVQKLLEDKIKHELEKTADPKDTNISGYRQKKLDTFLELNESLKKPQSFDNLKHLSEQYHADRIDMRQVEIKNLSKENTSENARKIEKMQNKNIQQEKGSSLDK